MGAPHQLGGGAALTSPPARPPEPPTVRISEVAGISLDRHLLFWVAALVTVALVLWLLGEVLLPFVAAMALAYVLDPLTTRLERAGIYRPLAALATISLVVLAFIVLILLIAPIVVSQFAALIEHIPGYIRRVQALIADPSRPWLQRFLGEGISGSDKSSSDLVAQGMGWFTTFLGSLWAGGRAVVSIFSLLVITPIVAFYLLNDWRRLVATVDRWIPLPHRDTVRGLARDINKAIAGYVRGQSLVCLLLGSFYAIGLTLAGLNFGLLIGVISGLITFIPYVGSMTGLVLALAVAVAQFWPDWTWILVVLAIFLTGQFLEGNVLTPKLIGDSAGLHPVWLMFALFAFGYLFGFVGLLLAVPLAAAIGVLARFALRRYLESPLYTGAEPG
jgi:predicted PurR-regulated permease PerM